MNEDELLEHLRNLNQRGSTSLEHAIGKAVGAVQETAPTDSPAAAQPIALNDDAGLARTLGMAISHETNFYN